MSGPAPRKSSLMLGSRRAASTTTVPARGRKSTTWRSGTGWMGKATSIEDAHIDPHAVHFIRAAAQFLEARKPLLADVPGERGLERADGVVIVAAMRARRDHRGGIGRDRPSSPRNVCPPEGPPIHRLLRTKREVGRRRDAQAVADLDRGVVQDDVPMAGAIELEGRISQVVHRIANEIGRATQPRLRAQAHEAIGEPIAHDTAIVKAKIGLDPIIGAGVDVVVDRCRCKTDRWSPGLPWSKCSRERRSRG